MSNFQSSTTKIL